MKKLAFVIITAMLLSSLISCQDTSKTTEKTASADKTKTEITATAEETKSAEPTAEPTSSEPTAEPTETTEPSETAEPTDEPTETAEPTAELPCTHESTSTVGAKAASCTEDGYTGDTVCDKCGEVIAKGEVIEKSSHDYADAGNARTASCSAEGYTGDKVCTVCGDTVYGSVIPKTAHTPVVINQKSAVSCAEPGYSGDTVCSVCGEVISYGYQITLNHSGEKIVVGYTEATESSEGYSGDTVCPDCGYVYRKGAVIPKLQGLTHDYATLETMILDAVNAERAKVGLYPYVWNEAIYAFAKTRVNELPSRWSHTRPDGSAFSTVITDDMYKTARAAGENLCFITCDKNTSYDEIVEMTMQTLMASTLHREAILSSEYESIAIALCYGVHPDYPGFNVCGYFTTQFFWKYAH